MCTHDNFSAQVNVSKLKTDEDSSVVFGYCADIKINCEQCGQSFGFIGVSAGYSPLEPKVSVDMTELRVPIAPADGILVFDIKDNKQN